MKRSRWKTEEYINTESHRGSEHAASEPNGVPLHLVGDHLHVDRLRLKNRSQVKDTIGDMCGFRRRHYRSILNTSYFNINLFSLTRHSPPMPKEPLPSGDSLIASHYHRQQSSLSLAQSIFSGLSHVTSVSKAAILKEKILIAISDTFLPLIYHIVDKDSDNS